jgi:hypothetical protein
MLFVNAIVSSGSSSEPNEFDWFLANTLEHLLKCDDRELAMGGIFDALAIYAFRRSFVPILIERMKSATANLEQLQRSSRYH